MSDKLPMVRTTIGGLLGLIAGDAGVKGHWLVLTLALLAFVLNIVATFMATP